MLALALLLALTPAQASFLDKLAEAALQRTKAPHVTYDPAYVRLGYPGGDVQADRGVCADVVIRSYRALGIDLQRVVHEDMAADFGAYPKLWKLKKPDANIDHRRVPNLRVFFTRHGVSLPTSGEFLPGDIVTLTVAGKLPHIGIVSARKSASGVPLLVHNIGEGEVLEDALFAYPMTGHYRYFGG
jgi:uncharacterized protein YijF (DUF1287 family)